MRLKTHHLDTAELLADSRVNIQEGGRSDQHLHEPGTQNSMSPGWAPGKVGARLPLAKILIRSSINLMLTSSNTRSRTTCRLPGEEVALLNIPAGAEAIRAALDAVGILVHGCQPARSAGAVSAKYSTQPHPCWC